MESKQAGIIKNMKKPLNQLMAADNVDQSLDKEMSDSIDRPLFQADKKDNSGLSGQGMRIGDSESNRKKEISGQHGMVGDGIGYDMNGYFTDYQDNFAADQQEMLQNNMFTQDLAAMSDQKRRVDNMSFDDIKEKLERELLTKTSKPKIEKNNFVKVDDNLTSVQTTRDIKINYLSSLAIQGPEIRSLDYMDENLEVMFKNLQAESKEAHRAEDILQEDILPGLEIDMPDFDFGLGNDAFEEIDMKFQVQDQFIGDENANLELPDQFTESQGSYVDKIMMLLPKGGKKKAAKLHFTDIVKAFSTERDPADLFYDLMCAGKTGGITLGQSFPSEIDRETNLPVIEVALPHN